MYRNKRHEGPSHKRQGASKRMQEDQRKKEAESESERGRGGEAKRENTLGHSMSQFEAVSCLPESRSPLSPQREIDKVASC